MSNKLCKLDQGRIGPFGIKTAKDSVNNSLYAIGILETTHGSGASSDFAEGAFNNVCGSNLTTDKDSKWFPDRKGEESQESIDGCFDTGDSFWIGMLPG